jgi:putative membrane protein
MVTWFAGLFYLPRLFVYHAMTSDQISQDRFKTMERKLYFGITTPGAVLTIIFGIWLLYDYAWDLYKGFIWLHIKLGLVVMLALFHIYCGHLVKKFKFNHNTHTHVYYRWLNEFPVLILVAVVLLATVKPF